jgi:hypothetical protein
MFKRVAIPVGLLLFTAHPAWADDFQYIETFEYLEIGTTDFAINYPYFNVFVSGGSVVALDAQPGHSGTKGYRGTSITVRVDDPSIYSLPGIGAWIDTPGVVTLQAYRYDPGFPTELPSSSAESPAGMSHYYLTIGEPTSPLEIAKATFTVGGSKPFVMDDLTLGLEGVGPGIPEPASWAMMLGGFGLAGGAMRRGRAQASAWSEPRGERG